jgi:hypothetical protein
MSATAVPDITAPGKTFDVGDVATVTITTTNAAGNVADPATLVVRVKPIGADLVVYTYGTDAELTKTSTGVYSLAHPITTHGTHHVRVITTGDAGAEPGSFHARPDNTI